MDREKERERARGGGGGRASIWLNRNGRGDIFKPGKVWCLVLTRGCAGRASHKFTLSYHLIATIAAQTLGARSRGRRSTEIWPARNRLGIIDTMFFSRGETKIKSSTSSSSLERYYRNVVRQHAKYNPMELILIHDVPDSERYA